MSDADIRVLLVEEPDRRAELRKLLLAAQLNVIDEAGFGSEAVTVAGQARPDVVVLSMEEPVVRPLKAIEGLLLSFPNLPIVVVSSLGDRDHLRKAMQAGARDYLVRPVRAQELRSAVAELYAAEVRRQSVLEGEAKRVVHGDVLAVFAVKGGVGKTSLSVNLAAALAQQTRQRVGLLDLDLQLGDVAVALGIVPEHTIADVAASASRLEPSLLHGMTFADPSGVHVLPAPLRPEEGEQISLEEIQRIVTVMAQTYDYVVVDMPPLITEATSSILDQATLVLLITTQDMLTLRRTKVALQVMRAWGYSQDKVKLVLNHAYSANGLAGGDVQQALDYPVYWSVPNDAAVASALKVGRPLVVASPNSRAGRSVVDLARDICGSQTAPSSGGGSLLAKLRRR